MNKSSDQQHVRATRFLSVVIVFVMISTAFFVFIPLSPAVERSTGCAPARIWFALVVGMNAGDGTHSNQDELLAELLENRYVDVDFHFTKRGATFKYVPSAEKMMEYDLVIFYTDPDDTYPRGYYPWGYYTRNWDNITEYCEEGGRVMVLLNGDYSAYYLTASYYGRRSTTQDYLGWTSGYSRDVHYWSESCGHTPDWPLYGQPDTSFEGIRLRGSGYFWNYKPYANTWRGCSPYPYAGEAETLLYSKERDDHNKVPIRCGVGYKAEDWISLTWNFAWFRLDEDSMEEWFFESLLYLRIDGRRWVPESPAISEVYDEGLPGDDQFVELYNPLWSDYSLRLSEFYLSVEDNPQGEEDAYGSYDLTIYDDDNKLDVDDYPVVSDDNIDLGSYKRIGVYWKERDYFHFPMHDANELAYEIGWGAAGEGLDPVNGLSCQLPWDRYRKELNRYWKGFSGAVWTLAPPSPGVRNTASAPDFESYTVVINEVNADYVELYNSGSSPTDLGGYKVCGFRNAYTVPTETRVKSGDYYLIPKSKLFIGDDGGDIKLLNEMGVLIDVITWAPSGGRAATSYAARHFDGVGPRGVYLQEMGGDYENRNFDQKNQWWEFGVAATKGTANYNGTTILIDGMNDVFQLFNETGSVYKDGILKENVEDIGCLDPWDVVLYSGELGTKEASLLSDYLDDGGRLYLESDDFIGISEEHENFYDLLHIHAQVYPDGYITTGTIAGDLFVDDMGFDYQSTAEVKERINPLDDALRLFYLEDSPQRRFGAAYMKHPTTGYRAVCSSLRYEDMLNTGENVPDEFMNAMMKWFLTPDLNNAPSITLREGQLGGTVLVDDEDRLSALGWLGWSNDDKDHWDFGTWKERDEFGHTMYKFMEFTIYLDTDMDKVRAYAPNCQVVTTGNTTFYLPQGLEPGRYFWTVTAEDRYWKEGGAVDEVWGDPILFSFYYDNKKPEMLSIRPYFKGVADTGPEMLGFHEKNGYYPTFGPGGLGKPEGVLFTVYDEHLGLSFTKPKRSKLSISYAHSDPDICWMTEERMRQLNDISILARNGSAIYGENGKNTVVFIMKLPDFLVDEGGTMWEGRYRITYRLVDYVGNFIEGDIIFYIDADAPDAVTDMYITTVDHPIYVSTGIQYLKAGETYLLNGTGPTKKADGTLDRIEFVMMDKLFNSNEVVLEVFKVGESGIPEMETKNYIIEFEAVRDYEYFYAVTYDRAGNYAMSKILTDIIVDAYAPTKPYDIEVESSPEGCVNVSGWARDSQVWGKTSGMSYVFIYVNGEVVRHKTSGNYGWRDNETYEAGEPVKVQVVASRFKAEIPLKAININDGDIKNVIQVRGVDNVGNMGEKSDASEVAPIRMLDPKESLNVEIREMAFGLSDGVDQLKEISVTFLRFPPGELKHHTIEMTYHAEVPDVDVSAIAMVGYWTVDADIEGDFQARIKIFFQHPTISAFAFNSLKLVTKGAVDNKWSVVEDAVFVHQEANPAQGIPELYYVEATVTSFSDFAIIQGKPDLRISDTHIFANPMVGGQTVRISATVRNVGEFSGPAEDVTVRVYYVDEEGAESTIGWITFTEPIAAGKANEQTGEVLWETPVVTDVEKMTFYVKFKVDPNAEIAEYDETNNDAFIDENNDKKIDPIEVLRISYTVPSFALSWMMVVVAALMVVGAAVVLRKRRD